MGSVAAQYINLTPLVVFGLILYVIVPFVACVLAGAAGTSDGKGAVRGALCGALTVVVSAMGCGVATEYTDDSLGAYAIQALVTAGVGAVVTYWVVGLKFWNN